MKPMELRAVIQGFLADSAPEEKVFAEYEQIIGKPVTRRKLS
jgi:hypothetical protein